MSVTAPEIDAGFSFDNSYHRELAGCYVDWQAAKVAAPRLLKLNRALAGELGLNADRLDSAAGARVLVGNSLLPGAQPLAQAYAGHQFGGFSPQLGDGRALLLGELIDRQGRRRDLQLKGSGRTPFSRGGDGKAAVGPVLREYLIGEAMHAMGIPTTRALAAVATGEQVFRETPLPGAVLARVAASHLRVGTFEYFAARRETESLQRLLAYAIARHDPGLADHDRPALAFLAAVVGRQAALIARWMQVGFIHGVMNTDNMTISGETIDYGPCAFMDRYDPATVFSSIDHHGRYAYGNQPGIGVWNLARLAEALLPLIDAEPDRAVESATEVLQRFGPAYESHWLAGMRAKLGLVAAVEPAGPESGPETPADEMAADDRALVRDLLDILHAQAADFTGSFRALADVLDRDESRLRVQCRDPAALDPWLARWRARLRVDPGLASPERARAMRAASPIYIPRNHLVERALAAAVEEGDLEPFEALLEVLGDPFTERPGLDAYTQAAPDGGAGYQTFCGT
ncbi:MAG: YdiU family protein [Burkholderiaceae bacterium]